MASGIERFVATMVFCDAPFEGTLAPAVPAAGHDNKSGGGGGGFSVASFMAAAKETAKHYFSSGAETPSSAAQRQGPVDGVRVFMEAVALE